MSKMYHFSHEGKIFMVYRSCYLCREKKMEKKKYKRLPGKLLSFMVVYSYE